MIRVNPMSRLYEKLTDKHSSPDITTVFLQTYFKIALGITAGFQKLQQIVNDNYY